jgi:hypothetical protein
MKKLFSGKTFAVSNEAEGGRWRQSITYVRDDINRAYRYYPNWTKTGLDYSALGPLTKEKVKGPRIFQGKTFNNLEAFCLRDELSQNSQACSTVFRKGSNYYLGTDPTAVIRFSDGYHNLLTPLVQRAVKGNNNKLLWALAGDFKRLVPDLVAKFRVADMRVWAQNQDQIRAQNKQIDAANKRAETEQAAKAKAQSRAREAKCLRETGKACPKGGGLLGAPLVGTIKAVEGGGASSGSAGGGGATYVPNYTYTLVCRQRLLMDMDNWRDGPSMICSGQPWECERKFEEQISAQYGSLYKACRVIGQDWTDDRIKHN